MSGRRWVRPAPAEMALVLVSAAAAGGFVRLFSDASFLAPALVAVVVAHGLAMALRRLEVGPVAAVALSGLALVATVGWVVEPHTLTLGLPLARTWRAVAADLHAAVTLFGEVRAPTPPTRGFVLACTVAVWVAASTADTLAFRARTRFEALTPSFVVFLFGAVLGADRHRLAATGCYLAAVLAFVVSSDASGRTGPTWFGGRAGDGRRSLVRSGAVAATATVAVAMVVGPRIPGAHQQGALGWRTGVATGSGSRVTVSPLVDIRSRLVDPSGTELFSVASPTATYWRLTSLERFDGTIWSSVGTYGPARGRLPAGDPDRSAGFPVRQQFDIAALSTIWLPAAYRPSRVDGIRGVRFDPDSSSLLVDEETKGSLRYRVESRVPELDPAQLQSASAVLAGEEASRYLALPPNFPARVRRLASQVTAASAATCQALGCSPGEVTAGRLTPFHQARALQDWLRSSFAYDLDVPPGHDEAAIERFLFTTRRGYCEQFAGSFAAMARSLGLPSRVAVGFTPGRPGDDGRWHVTDREAHAWPEVYLAPLGWVAFEPTPGRAIPGGEAYTGVGQAPAAAAAEEPGAPAPALTTTTVAGGPAPVPTTATAAPSAQVPVAGEHRRRPLAIVLTVVLTAAAMYLAGMPLAHRLRRRRWRAGAKTPDSRVHLAWWEAADDLALAGMARRPAETAPEYAARAAAIGGGVGEAAAELAACLTTADFSPAGADGAVADRAESAAVVVRAGAASVTAPVRRHLRTFDPRSLAPPGRARRRRHRR